MWLSFLAIVPSIAVLIYIYKKDKKEKEPIRLLLGCFFWGVVSVIPIIFVEEIVDEVRIDLFGEGSFLAALFEGIIVAGLTEEFFKRLFLKWKTWKNKYFDCMFDGIVYSVFVSLGFATFENILYVFDSGIGTAFLRMFTSIPGHTCFGIYMGYYYSKAKLAQIEGNKKEYKKNKNKSLWVPVLMHGIYDFLLMMEEDMVGEAVTTVAVFLWLAYVVVLYIYTFKFIKKASDDDRYIAIHPDNNERIVVDFKRIGTWKCSCGVVNMGNYCTACGIKRPVIIRWKCPECGSDAIWNYCEVCGSKRPEDQAV